MGSEESAVYQSSDKPPQGCITGQILISIHGSAGTGKSTLVKHMVREPFQSFYNPTKQMEATQVLWKSIQYPNTVFRVIVWDVVESATTPSPSTPDAATVDTITRADGIILLYNPDDYRSVDYALSILYKLPTRGSSTKSYIPVLILSNFLDTRSNIQKVHPLLRNVPYYQIQTSLKSGIGLDIVAIWLDRAFLYNRQKSLNAQLWSVQEESQELLSELRRKTKEKEDKLLKPKKNNFYNFSAPPNADNQPKPFNSGPQMPTLSELLTPQQTDESKEGELTESKENTEDQKLDDSQQDTQTNQENTTKENETKNGNEIAAEKKMEEQEIHEKNQEEKDDEQDVTERDEDMNNENNSSDLANEENLNLEEDEIDLKKSESNTNDDGSNE